MLDYPSYHNLYQTADGATSVSNGGIGEDDKSVVESFKSRNKKKKIIPMNEGTVAYPGNEK